jgi:para-nitrobenzyl esterase
VYRYRFDFAVPADLKNHHVAAAYHSAEIEYVFGQLDWKDLPWRAEDRALSAQMQNYWVNFARSGDPNGVGLPKWPAYEADSGWAVMHLGVRSEANKDDLRARYVFLDGIRGRP